MPGPILDMPAVTPVTKQKTVKLPKKARGKVKRKKSR